MHFAPYLHLCEQGSPDKFSVIRNMNRVWFSLSWIQLNFDQDEYQFTWINPDTLRVCCEVNGALVTLLTSSIYKHMKRAATQLFKGQSNNRAFSKLSNFYFDLRPPWQDKGAKTRPQGQLECADPRRLLGRVGGQA